MRPKSNKLTKLSLRGMLVVAATTACVFWFCIGVTAQVDNMLYSFASGGGTGQSPLGTLVRDTAGNLYGTAYSGGTVNGNCTSGCGTVFQLNSANTLTVLHAFAGSPSDGANPVAGLVRDLKGNLYGTTVNGGAHGAGSVFRVTATGSEKVLYSFTGGADGGNPNAGLVYAQGNLYGTTTNGGTSNKGTVFVLTPAGVETVLHSFTGGVDGQSPWATLIRDADGNLYGTTIAGGASGMGTVFEVTAAGVESVLYSFAGGADGAQPYGSLIRGKQGDLYGTTFFGGASSSGCPTGCGTMFHLAPTGVETILIAFPGGSKGANPQGGLVRDSKGNFWGTTVIGGQVKLCNHGCGTIFELTATGFPVLGIAFNGSPNDGQTPRAGLILDTAGNLYGTTQMGGSGGGTIFKYVP